MGRFSRWINKKENTLDIIVTMGLFIIFIFTTLLFNFWFYVMNNTKELSLIYFILLVILTFITWIGIFLMILFQVKLVRRVDRLHQKHSTK